MTEKEVCDRARAWLARDRSQVVKVTVFFDGGCLVGTLGKVSPVNAWIGVGGKTVPAGRVKRLEQTHG